MLDGIKIVSVCGAISGPSATRRLRDLGAEIIKVENINGGDPIRNSKHFYDPDIGEDLTYRFLTLNLGKKSIPIDLKSQEGHSLFTEIISDADVLVENLRPGSMENLYLDYESVEEINPEIIYCSISGYGETGPYRDRPALDVLIQSFSGLAYQNSALSDKPIWTNCFIADYAVGLYAVISILNAIIGKLQGNGGQYIDVSMLDCLVSIFGPTSAEYSARGKTSARLRSSTNPYGIFETMDGWLALAVRDKTWKPFCEVLGLQDWKNSKFKKSEIRNDNRNLIYSRLKKKLKQKPTEYWVNNMIKNGIMAAPVNPSDFIFSQDSLRDREVIRELTDESLGDYIDLFFPAVIEGDEFDKPSRVPRFGEHTREILQGLGYSIEKISELHDCDIVYDGLS